MSAAGLALLGSTGRMGRAILSALDDDDTGLRLCGAAASAGSPRIGEQLAGGIVVAGSAAQAIAGADVTIDFSLPEALPGNLSACVSAGCPLVLGVTGLDEEALDALHEAASAIPIVHAPNMSVGVNVAFGLAALAARTLGDAYQVEIVELHHRGKRDAPSGTALRFGEVIAAERGRRIEELAAGPDRAGARPDDAIGFASLRAGDVAGEHTILFAGPNERVEITHRANRREAFASGALRAAHWLAGRPPGLYGMADVLGL